MVLFTLCSCLKTKESYDRWITRRVYGFRHQISKAKNLKMLIANIGKLQENFVAVQEGYEISQHEGHHFTALQNWPSAWSDRLPMVVTPSFELRIMHCLKHWIDNFLSFETKYSMHKLSSRKCSKSG